MNRFSHLIQPDQGQEARDIHLIAKHELVDWVGTLPERARVALQAARFAANPGEIAILPGDKPDDWAAVLGIGKRRTAWDLASAAQKLPEGTYRLSNATPGMSGLGWMLAHYRFDRFLSAADVPGERILLTTEPALISEQAQLAEATALVRDMVNMPAADLGPAELQAHVEALGKEFDAPVTMENAIAANALRPGDILRSRKGISVEIDNTDAEGRLILGDALTKAAESNPELMIDFATLTGAARVALGPDLPALFVNDDVLATDIADAASQVEDPIWRMPLWDGYDDMLKSDIADMVNSAEGGMAGCVTAALFLRRFVPEGTSWIHFDTIAWRPSSSAGRPKGGEALGLRASFELLKRRYARA